MSNALNILPIFLISILLAVGVVLLFLELLIPGFGVFGISGAILVGASVYIIGYTLLNKTIALILTVIVIILIFSIFWLLAKKSKKLNKMVLNTEMTTALGYNSITISDELIGEIGIAKTFLRPVGIMKLNNKLYDVQTKGEFIEQNKSIKVISIENGKIIVQKLEEDLNA